MSTSTHSKDLRVPPTFAELQKLLPDAVLETTGSGEVIIFTGWAVNSDDEDGPLVAWCEECNNGADAPCEACGSEKGR